MADDPAGRLGAAGRRYGGHDDEHPHHQRQADPLPQVVDRVGCGERRPGYVEDGMTPRQHGEGGHREPQQGRPERPGQPTVVDPPPDLAQQHLDHGSGRYVIAVSASAQCGTRPRSSRWARREQRCSGQR
ncbi:hypothetical protein TPA0907_57160 [Micromonospora humidisoli]|nr:hypothetical protein TPA0907_57160 [Micromonospora sp. AKA109]